MIRVREAIVLERLAPDAEAMAERLVRSGRQSRAVIASTRRFLRIQTAVITSILAEFGVDNCNVGKGIRIWEKQIIPKKVRRPCCHG